jgi:Zn-dependent protease with chaperone function
MNPAPDMYPGCAAGPNREEGDLAGSIRVTQLSIHFESDANRIEMPLIKLELNADPFDLDRIIFTHPSQPGWEISTYAKEILLHRNLANRVELRQKLRELQTEVIGPSKHTMKVYGIAAAILLLLVFLWLGNNIVVGMIVNAVPDSWEQALGDEVFAELKLAHEMSDDPAATNYVASVGLRLVKAIPGSSAKYRFHYSPDGVVNAYALPGGHIVIFQGLLNMVDSPEELAGVMAHEIAHVAKRHTLRKSAEAAGPMLAVKFFLGQKSAALSALAATSAYLGTQKYSRIYETEADDMALDYLVKAQINPQGLVDCFSKLQKKEGLAGKVTSLFDSHPATSERISRLKTKIAELNSKKYKPFPPLEKPEGKGESLGGI